MVGFICNIQSGSVQAFKWLDLYPKVQYDHCRYRIQSTEQRWSNDNKLYWSHMQGSDGAWYHLLYCGAGV